MNNPSLVDYSGHLAIVGMAGRFPGARDIDQFWQNLRDGVESVSFFTEEELRVSGVDTVTLTDPSYVPARAVLEDVDRFDAAFFGFSPREAEIMDPQHRLFLECAWEALEHAGYALEQHPGRVGVYAGASANTYLLSNLHAHPDLVRMVGDYQTMIANDNNCLATRVSYKLNLKGPSLTVQTACSTSLVATHLACQALLSGECDLALAGGVSIHVPQRLGYLYQEGGIYSSDGHCRAFDAEAQGTVSGEGVGVVVLKRLEEALADGDSICAIIKGSAINNDGALKIGYTAPSAEGQAAVIAEAQALATVEPETIGYVEAHGTATPLGDPIEVAALTQVFRIGTHKTSFCALGSVKTNLGHLDAAAGVAGLIKTVLALQHRQIPPSLHFERPNPQIAFANSPFYVNARLAEWSAGSTPRRAGVSCFGVGGTNAHVILEEAPLRPASSPSRPWQLLMLSAKTEPALEAASDNLARHLQQHPEQPLADVAYTLQVGRQVFSHRRAVVCQAPDQVVAALQARDPDSVLTAVQRTTGRPVAFMFPGQGAQHIGMAGGLYQTERVFRETFDTCAGLLMPFLERDLRDILYPDADRIEAAAQDLTQAAIAQAALFAIEYALARLWMAWGLQPRALIGHSVGEYVAACLSGVFALEDALRLVAARGRLMQHLPGGTMLAVALSEEQVHPLLGDLVALAVVNGRSRCVLAGPEDALDALRERLAERGVDCQRLRTSHAFHSQMMDPILEPFVEEVQRIALQAPQIPFVSNVTGTWITAEEATDPTYWARHLRQTVRFSAGLRELLSDPELALLEVGPGQALSVLARQHPDSDAGRVIRSSLPRPNDGRSDAAALIETLGRLWLADVPIDWSGFYADETRRRLPMPTYPFQRERFWIDRPRGADQQSLRDNVQEQPSQASTAQSSEPDGIEKEVVVSTKSEEQRAPVIQPARHQRVSSALRTIFSQLLGFDPAAIKPHVTFLEMGVDSLLLMQASRAIDEQLGVTIAFRQMLADTPTIDALSTAIDQLLPPDDLLPEQPAPALPRPAPAESLALETFDGAAEAPPESNDALEHIVARQLRIMEKQLDMLRSRAAPQPPGEAVSSPQRLPRATADSAAAWPLEADVGELGIPHAEPFVPYRSLKAGSIEPLAPGQQRHLDELIARHTRRTSESKRLTQAYRRPLADNRVLAGFSLRTKAMVYPIVVQHSLGSRLWDVDGNEYIDLTMGFGVHLFGHSPAFIAEALEDQLKRGVQLGPQSDLAGRVAELICELTGVERVAFCNSGTEAVMLALRVARTVTRRTTIALFAGSYHGTFDGVLARAQRVDGKPVAVPLAPGVPPGMVEDLLVLDYDRPESLKVLRSRAHTLAAVLVEPVQSRRPDLQPRAFLHALRQLTEAAGAALIFDDVVTGFRLHPGGTQAWFDISADLVTYGKVAGGGMPIGVVAGKARFMDAIDGGPWSYDDASYPCAEQTMFAGTFCKHPLAMAAALAVLKHLKQSGPQLQQSLNQATIDLTSQLDAHFTQQGLPIRIVRFGSLFRFIFPPELNLAEDLFFYHLLDKGMYVWEGRNCFLSTAHTRSDLDAVIQAVKEAAAELQQGGFLPGSPARASGRSHSEAALAVGSAPSGRNGPVVPRPSDGSLASAEPDTTSERADTLDRDTFPLTESQVQIWIPAQMGDDVSRTYNESVTFHIRGGFDLSALTTAVETVVARHEALRITISPDGTCQRVHDRVGVHIPFSDLSGLEGSARDAQKTALIVAIIQQAFDLVHGPLFHAQVVKLEERSHLFVFVAHHIVVDSRSTAVLQQEIIALYSAICEGVVCQLPEPTPFRAYARWQARLQESAAATYEAYWLEQFAGPLPILALPTDRPRPGAPTYNGSSRQATIGSQLSKALKDLSIRHGCTLFTTLFAGFNLLLHRLTGQTDLIVGVPVAGQSDLPTSIAAGPLVGYCINMLPLRSNVRGDMLFIDLLATASDALIGGYQHQHFSLFGLMSKLHLSRDPSRPALVAVTFNMEQGLAEKHELAHIDIDVAPNPKTSVYFDLSFDVTAVGDELVVNCEYSTDLFDDATIARLLRHYQTLLAGLIATPARRIAELPLLTAAEQHQLLVEWNATEMAYPQDATLHRLFEEQAARTSDAVAVVFDGAGAVNRELETSNPAPLARPAPGAPTLSHQITYAELNRRANQLARYLRRQGVAPERLVGLYMERSPEMLVGLLGILKAGGAYVPLDPEHPQARLAFMLEESRARVLLTQARLMNRNRGLGIEGGQMMNGFQSPTAVCLDADWPTVAAEPHENLEDRASPENLAYAMYTSGSTGRPKGALIIHRSLVSMALAATREFGMRSTDRFLQLASISFDVMVEEIFPTLVSGAAVVLPGESLSPLDLDELLRLVAHESVTICELTTAYWHELLQDLVASGKTMPPSLRLLLIGGERTSLERLAAWERFGIPLVNIYGLTEVAVTSIVYAPPAGDHGRDPRSGLPIGHPIANTQVYIVDAQMQLLPIGVPGELYIGGVGLGRGYVSRPDITAERFVPNPFLDQQSGIDQRPTTNDQRDRRDPGRWSLVVGRSSRLYKTGDLARYLPDGTIEYLGRIDHQVKLRGFRIEPGEVEATLAGHPAVRECVAIVREDIPGQPRLVTYVVPTTDRTGMIDRDLPTNDHGSMTNAGLGADPSSFVGTRSIVPVRRSSFVAAELRDFLQKRLPMYMVPTNIVLLDRLPLTTNGKLDHNALPAPNSAKPDLTAAFAAPRTPVEELLAGIWAEVLGIAQVGVYDNFFELGGHSLLAMQVVSKVRQILHAEISLRNLFEVPTVAGLASVIEQRQNRGGAADPSTPPILRRDRGIADLLAQIQHLSGAEVQTLLVLASQQDQPE